MTDNQKKKTRARKTRAVMTVIGVGVLCVTPLFILNNAMQRSEIPEPPWSFPTVTAQSADGKKWNVPVELGAPVAVIYVSQSCLHCKAELERWSTTVGEVGMDKLWVVASSDSDIESLDWVPSPLRSRTVKDGDGSVAEALGVRLVPATFWIDDANVVQFVKVGQSSSAEILEKLYTIADLPLGQKEMTTNE